MQYPPPCAFTKITQEPEIIKSETYKINQTAKKNITSYMKIEVLY